MIIRIIRIISISANDNKATMKRYKNCPSSRLVINATMKRYKNYVPFSRLVINIFDSLIMPIITYGSEIWGALSARLKPEGDLYIQCEKLPVESLPTAHSHARTGTPLLRLFEANSGYIPFSVKS